ncbi:MAG: helix-turn-helix domain-containing protein [Mucilaginibacter sp.]
MKWYDYAKGLMADKKIKQDDLLNVFNVKTRGAVGHYLSGRRTPSAEQLKSLADRLGISLDELMSGELDYTEQRPPVIDEESWKSLSPRTRAFVEEVMNKTTENKIQDDDLKFLQDMLDKLAGK